MRHVLVTGAGGGLGACVCGQLAATGDTVFATDADLGALRQFRGMRGVVPLRMDVTSARDVTRVRTRIDALTDGLDGLVYCAGVFAAGALVEADERAMARALAINLMGAFRCVQAFFPHLQRRTGTVVLIGTELSHCAMPFNGPYTISKSALQTYADALRRELMFLGMRVAVVQPGAIRTPLLRGARSDSDGRKERTLFPAQLALIRRMLSREWETGMEPSDVARVVVRAAHARTARAVYRVGNDPFRLMLGRLPARWTDLLLRLFVTVRSAGRHDRGRHPQTGRAALSAARAASVRSPGPGRR